MQITVYSKRRCSLCDDARDLLVRLRERYGFDLQEVDIEASPSDWERFRFDVPVIFVDGVRTWQHRLDPDEVEKQISISGTSVAPTRRTNA